MFAVVMFFCFGYAFIEKNTYAEESERIFNFDTSFFVNKGTAAENDRASATFTTEQGLLHMQNATNWQGGVDDGFFLTYTGANLSDTPVKLDDYKFFKIRFKRINCRNNRMLLYIWGDNPSCIAPCFMSINVGEKYDGKWIDLIVPMTLEDGEFPTVYIKDIETGASEEIVISNVNNFSGMNVIGNLKKIRFNFCREVNLNREAFAEYFGFCSTLERAKEYDGNAVEKLENAENYILNNELRSEFALSENTEEKLLVLIKNFIEDNKNIGVQAEISN